MKDNWYLLWDPLNGWNVHTEMSVPDQSAFPEDMYQRYAIERDKGIDLMRGLMKIRDKLRDGDVMPTKENRREIYPELEEILNEP